MFERLPEHIQIMLQNSCRDDQKMTWALHVVENATTLSLKWETAKKTKLFSNKLRDERRMAQFIERKKRETLPQHDSQEQQKQVQEILVSQPEITVCETNTQTGPQITSSTSSVSTQTLSTTKTELADKNIAVLVPVNSVCIQTDQGPTMKNKNIQTTCVPGEESDNQILQLDSLSKVSRQWNDLPKQSIQPEDITHKKNAQSQKRVTEKVLRYDEECDKYLVKWKGLSKNKASWVPCENLDEEAIKLLTVDPFVPGTPDEDCYQPVLAIYGDPRHHLDKFEVLCGVKPRVGVPLIKVRYQDGEVRIIHVDSLPPDISDPLLEKVFAAGPKTWINQK